MWREIKTEKSRGEKKEKDIQNNLDKEGLVEGERKKRKKWIERNKMKKEMKRKKE